MAANKRTETQRENDLEYTSELYLSGLTQMQIATAINQRAELNKWKYAISREQISKDIKELHKRWNEQAVSNIETYIQVELAKLDTLETTYWSAWERSLKATKESKKKYVAKILVEQTNTEKESVGNPIFLAGVQKCIEQRCKILRIEQPANENSTQPIQIVFERVRKKYDANDE